MTTKTATKPTAKILRHYNFSAVRVATKTHVFITILGHHFPGALDLGATEVYRIRHGVETFIGYADEALAERLAVPMYRAARIALQTERGELGGKWMRAA
jgi:hypothetical protein